MDTSERGDRCFQQESASIYIRLHSRTGERLKAHKLTAGALKAIARVGLLLKIQPCNDASYIVQSTHR